MGTNHSYITEEQATLIASAKLFFVATADPDLADGPHDVGPVNLSPKGGTPLHVLDRNRVAYLDYTGSGNETARHAAGGGPITIMVCSFGEEDAAIVRLYGKARITTLEESSVGDLLIGSPAEELKQPPRQVLEVHVERTATSCGYGVPVMSFVKERTTSDRGRQYKSKARSL